MMYIKARNIINLAIWFSALFLPFSAWAEEKTVEILAPWESEGEIFQVGEKQLLFHGTTEGIMYYEGSTGSLNATVFRCAMSHEMNTDSRATHGRGNCTFVGPQGGLVFGKLECKGKVGGCKGDFKITGGTERYAGITGSGEIIIRTALTEMMADFENGSIVGNASGLAVWPALKYKIPE